MADPIKTPWEIITGGLLALTGFGAWWMERRKKRKEYLDYEPIPKIDFEEYKTLMDTKFKEVDQKQMASNVAVLASIQNLKVDWARIEVLETARDERMNRIETRLNQALDKHPD